MAGRVTGLQGDLGNLRELAPRGRRPTWSCATGCSVWSTTRPLRCKRSPRCCAPAEHSRCWSTSVTPPCSPGRWPATSPRPCACSRVSPRAEPTAAFQRAPVHHRGAHRPARGSRVRHPHQPRHPCLHRPGALLPARPRAGRQRSPARAGTGSLRATRVPHPRQPAAPRRHPLAGLRVSHGPVGNTSFPSFAKHEEQRGSPGPWETCGRSSMP